MTSLLVPDTTRSVLTMTRSREPHPVLVVALYGELDLETSPAFAGYVDDSLRTRPMTTALILDLTELGFLSTHGLRVLAESRAHHERHGIRVAVVADGMLARVLDAHGSVTRYATRREAICALEPAQL
jgi:anti-anti-sigma factor